MKSIANPRAGRRRFLRAGVALPLLCALPAAVRGQVATPACGDEEPTHGQTEGPFFSPNSPLRASLLDADLPGRRIAVAGSVLSDRCRPLSGALLDFWQADDNGDYDNGGYRLRGHQFTDAEGRYRLDTILPGLYPGRTRHIHVKLALPSSAASAPRMRWVLTTQLYFPGEPHNAGDFPFDPRLLLSGRGDAAPARFDFVLLSA